jgi:N-succinyldiaminopimelate aminotransferase
VAAIPSAAFYDAPGAGRAIARFAFCKREDVIREASARLAAAPWPTARAAG